MAFQRKQIFYQYLGTHLKMTKGKGEKENIERMRDKCIYIYKTSLNWLKLVLFFNR